MTELKKQVALHVCCGPCAIEPDRVLGEQGYERTFIFHNPNIHPIAEYDKRRNVAAQYASRLGITFLELPYRPEQWIGAVGSACSSDLNSSRCEACYELRLAPVAAWARQHDFDGFATTLTVSPYQNQVVLQQVAMKLSARYEVPYLGDDYSSLYPEATKKSRELGMYRQNYCGCILSDIEAREQRASRRAARRTVGPVVNQSLDDLGAVNE